MVGMEEPIAGALDRIGHDPNTVKQRPKYQQSETNSVDSNENTDEKVYPSYTITRGVGKWRLWCTKRNRKNNYHNDNNIKDNIKIDSNHRFITAMVSIIIEIMVVLIIVMVTH